MPQSPYGLVSNLRLPVPLQSSRSQVKSPTNTGRLINMYAEVLDKVGAVEAQAVLRSTPGQALLVDLPGNDYTYSIFTYKGKLLALTDSGLHSITISTGGYETLIPAQMTNTARIAVSNTAIMVATNGELHEWTEADGHQSRFVGDNIRRTTDRPNALGAITDNHIIDIININAFFIVTTPNTMYAIGPDLVWTNQYAAVGDRIGGPVEALVNNNNQMWVFSDRKMEVWTPNTISTELPGFPFIPNTATAWEIGVVHKNTIVNYNNQTYFLGSTGDVYAGNDQSNVQILHSPSVAEAVRKSDITNISGYVYSEAGHTFYCLVLPESTWCYDVYTQLWHERVTVGLPRGMKGHIVSDATESMLVTYTASKVSPKVFVSSLDYITDDTYSIPREVVIPALDGALQHYSYWDFSIGIQITRGSSKFSVGLSFSDDNGHTFSHENVIEYQSDGFFNRRPRFYRLGRSASRAFKIRVYATAAIEISSPEARVTT